jgi:hypothetical protein
MQKTKRSRITRGMCRVFGVLGTALLLPAGALAQNWKVGDVFVGVPVTPPGSNVVQYQVWHPGTSPQIQTIIGEPGTPAGCTFDAAYRLFGTNSTNSDVVRFAIDNAADIANAPLPIAIPAHLRTGAESVAFDGKGNFYVGYANGGLEGYSHDGIPLTTCGPQQNVACSFTPTTDSGGGVNWIDVSADGHTIFYTSLSRKIYTWDTSTSGPSRVYADLALVSPKITGKLHAIRIFPKSAGSPGDGSNGVLVADEGAVRWVKGACNVGVDCATAPTVISNNKQISGNFQTLSLDPLSATPGNPATATFWAGDVSTNNVLEFTLISKQPIATIATGISTSTPLTGLCVHSHPRRSLGQRFGNLARLGG